jgi:hypothetical protein
LIGSPTSFFELVRAHGFEQWLKQFLFGPELLAEHCGRSDVSLIKQSQLAQ